ncbi:MAG: ABC transporter ATP-binding protein [Armatimonadetes bacterium]|nr:ABC transporter ATP-binding protein [Armatimonadota bacterium]
MAMPDPTTKKPLDWKSVVRVMSLALPYRNTLILAGTLSLLGAGLSLALPLFARNAVDQVTKLKDVGALDRAAFGIIGITLLAAAMSYAQYVMISKIGHRIVMELRNRVFGHLLRLPVTYFDSKRSGDIASFLSNDISQIQSVATSDVVNFASNLIKLIGGIVIAVVIDWQLCLFVVVLLGVMMAVFVVLGKRLRKLNRSALDRLSESMGAMTESLGQVRLVKAFVREDHETQKSFESLDKVFRLNVQSSRWEAAMGSIALTGFTALLIIVLWYGGRGVMSGTLSPGAIVGFFLVVTIISGPMGELASLTTRIQRAVGAADRVFEILDEAPERDEPKQAVKEGGPCDVTFTGVNFQYIDGQPVLENFDFRLAGGKVTALVGPSGGGKSTVASLLYRFYEPKSGSIQIDGQEVSELPLSELRSMIGIVPQETLLFSDTIFANLHYGNLEASREEVLAAAKAANVDEFVREFVDGYDTKIGERGVTLSGGQRQRVAIARAILKNPRILVLDEATSALDAQSESYVQEALDRLMEGRTTLVIAHRLSTVQNADTIAVLKDGQIAESGRHEELLARQGTYAQLQNLLH